MCKKFFSFPLFFVSFTILFFLCSVGYFAFVLDDAYISFRYAYNLAHGFGLRFNPADPPIEGYTNFLWVVIGALLELLHLPLTIFMPLISICCGLFAIKLIFDIVSQYFDKNSALTSIFLLVLTPTFIIWSTSGLATMPYALLMVLLYKLSVFDFNKKPSLTIIVALTLSTIRFEGIFFACFILGLAFLASKERRKIFKTGLIFIFIYGIYYSFRSFYFHDFVPNTVYMKVGTNPQLLLRGAKYCAIYFFSNPISFLSLPALLLLFIKKSLFRWSILAFYLALLAYPILVGGDFMPFSRFYLPLVIFQIIPIAFMLKYFSNKVISVSFITVGIISYLNLFNISPFPNSFLRTFHYRYNKSSDHFKTESEFLASVNLNNQKNKAAVKALNQISKQGDSITLTAIGLVGYYTKLHVYDCYGLITTELRDIPTKKLRSPGHDKGVKANFFLKNTPTIMNLSVDRKETLNNHLKSLKRLKDKYDNKYSLLVIPDNDFAITLLKRNETISNSEKQFVID